jgi:hypothetical protein
MKVALELTTRATFEKRLVRIVLSAPGNVAHQRHRIEVRYEPSFDCLNRLCSSIYRRQSDVPSKRTEGRHPIGVRTDVTRWTSLGQPTRALNVPSFNDRVSSRRRGSLVALVQSGVATAVALPDPAHRVGALPARGSPSVNAMRPSPMRRNVVACVRCQPFLACRPFAARHRIWEYVARTSTFAGK